MTGWVRMSTGSSGSSASPVRASTRSSRVPSDIDIGIARAGVARSNSPPAANPTAANSRERSTPRWAVKSAPLEKPEAWMRRGSRSRCVPSSDSIASTKPTSSAGNGAFAG